MRVNIRISIKDLPRQLWGIADAVKPAMKRGALSAVMRMIPVMQERAQFAPPANPAGIGNTGAIDTGAYRAGFRGKATDRGASLYNMRKYAPVIDMGRRPGTMPNTRAIARWAERKLGLDPIAARTAGFLIGRAIKRRGLLPRRVMTGNIDYLVQIFREEVHHEIRAAIRGAAVKKG